MKIPLELDKDEILVRSVFHPLFYSNSAGALKESAFLPPPNKKDVSLLRLSYTNVDFCKKHSMSIVIANNNYCGLATFYLHQANKIVQLQDVLIKPEIKATPIDENNQYVETEELFLEFPGLPMHADLLYPTPVPIGQPATEHRKFAKKLAKEASFYPDPLPLIHGKWTGKDIVNPISKKCV